MSRRFIRSAMKKKPPLKFVVRSEDGRRSGVWLICISNNDVYVSMRPLARQLKMSIHKSGECQVAFTTEFIEKIKALGTWPKRSRRLDKWSPKELSNGVALAARIIIPTSELSKLPISEREPVISIPAAPLGKAVEFAILLTAPHARVTGWPGKRSMKTQLIAKSHLPNGNTLWVVNRTVDPPQGDLDKIADIEVARRGIVRLDSHDKINLLDRQLRIVLGGRDASGVGYLVDAVSPWKKSSVS